MSSSWVRVEDSAPRRPAGAQRVDDADPDQQVTVTVGVRGRDAAGLAAHLRSLDQSPAAERRHLTRQELAERYGAAPADLDRVAAFYREQGLAVLERSAARRCIVVRGTAAGIAAAFGIRFGTYRYEGGAYRGHDDPVLVPAELAEVIAAALGLEDRPQARPCFVVNPKADAIGFTPAQVGQIYDFPQASGAGQCIGIVELGGGYTRSDLEEFFGNAKLSLPEVTAVSVDGATNSPVGGTAADREVALDIQIAGATAPQAHIAVYFAPNTDRGFYDAVTTAIHDDTNNPSAVSISWGSAECTWTIQAMDQMEQAFADAAALGVTITTAPTCSPRCANQKHPRINVKTARRYVVVAPRSMSDAALVLYGHANSAGGDTVMAIIENAYVFLDYYTGTPNASTQLASVSAGFVPRAIYVLRCGIAGSASTYEVLRNGQTMLSYFDSNNTTHVGSGYRQGGFGMLMGSSSAGPRPSPNSRWPTARRLPSSARDSANTAPVQEHTAQTRVTTSFLTASSTPTST